MFIELRRITPNFAELQFVRRLCKLREVHYSWGSPTALRRCLRDEFGIHPKGGRRAKARRNSGEAPIFVTASVSATAFQSGLPRC